MDKTKLIGIAGAALFALATFSAFNAHSNYQNSRTQAQNSITELHKTQNKSETMIKGVSKGVVYLKPEGSTSMVDTNYNDIYNILQDTFVYSSPKDFKAKAEQIKPQVTGSFYDYWFKGGIKNNYGALVDMANGRSLKRFAKTINLTRYGKNHYFAIVATGVSIDGASESSISPVLFGIDITRAGNKWRFTKINNFDSATNSTLYSNADDNPAEKSKAPAGNKEVWGTNKTIQQYTAGSTQN